MSFTRTMLREARKRAAEAKIDVPKNLTTYNPMGDHYEVWSKDGSIVWQGGADDAYEAKASYIDSLLPDEEPEAETTEICRYCEGTGNVAHTTSHTVTCRHCDGSPVDQSTGDQPADNAERMAVDFINHLNDRGIVSDCGSIDPRTDADTLRGQFVRFMETRLTPTWVWDEITLEVEVMGEDHDPWRPVARHWVGDGTHLVRETRSDRNHVSLETKAADAREAVRLMHEARPDLAPQIDVS